MYQRYCFCTCGPLLPKVQYVHCLLHLAETPNVTASCNWWLPTPWSLRWGLYVMGMHSGKWCSPGLHHTRLCPSLTYRQNLLSSLKTTKCHFTFQSTLSQQQSSSAWWCRGVSGSLAIDTCDLSSAASRWFPMVLGDTAGATCARISSLDVIWVATAACTMRQSQCAFVLHGHPEPVYGWGNVPQTTAESSDTSPVYCAQHVQQSINMSSQLPTGLQCDPFKWLKLFNRVHTHRQGIVVP